MTYRPVYTAFTCYVSEHAAVPRISVNADLSTAHVCSDSTPSLEYRVKMHGRSCDYRVYGSDTPVDLLSSAASLLLLHIYRISCALTPTVIPLAHRLCLTPSDPELSKTLTTQRVVTPVSSSTYSCNQRRVYLTARYYYTKGHTVRVRVTSLAAQSCSSVTDRDSSCSGCTVYLGPPPPPPLYTTHGMLPVPRNIHRMAQNRDR